MNNLFKQKKELFIENVNFDEYRKVANGTEIECRVNESISAIRIHQELNKLMVKTITTISGFDQDGIQIFSFVLRSGVQVHLKKKLEINNKNPSQAISDEVRLEAQNSASKENRSFIINFFKNTHLPQVSF